MEFKIGVGLSSLGLAVGIAQWLIPPDKLAYDIKFVILLIAIVLLLVGASLLLHAGWHYFKSVRSLASNQDGLSHMAALHLPSSWYGSLWRKLRPQAYRASLAVRPMTALIFDVRSEKYVQHGNVTWEVSGGRVPADEWIYAIGVVNLSGKSIGHCRLVLDSSSPYNPSEQRLERALRVRNDPRSESDGTFVLNPHDGMQPSVYVEVLQEIRPCQQGMKEQSNIRLLYANSKHATAHWFNDRDDHILTFRLEGDMPKAVTIQLSLGYNSQRTVRRWIVSSPNSANTI